ncbi:uncharacterized protein LOC121735635 [Aricia agestis]|uniref:uncharacterized protein LOC121735635 n=1 Tax=Aricia agestis TaxID=91739 RepID=UPI001C20B3A3|nr:uncharacterized protein LOC121735635 [Aricia agestis]
MSLSTAVLYMECQHATVVYYDRNYLSDVVFTSKRYKRENPIYFQTVSGKLLKYADNSYTLHFYIYELLSNTYKRSFIEVNANFCDFMSKDNIFSRSLKSANFKLFTQCPIPPGEYHLDNMTTPFGPFLKGFPFKQGRIYFNVTRNDKVLASAYADMRIKEMAAKEFYKYIAVRTTT